ncbi:BLUF domain-containing protein [Hydrogenophaga sp.]|uniref:BLUF domain-containing protein n=1 Tax=Hydrogenophaga sp. TaxID=1904254 RepID=UPI00272322CC|nr:BLUF domain-containing protein [Hydrogenophaga sp.]MDO8903803.1 BLUF domain-containing protein [Hydrogenophaga sp.]
MLIRLIYASRARSMGPMDIKDILASSRRNNTRLGVTGALCLSNGIFLQCLEGDRMVVNTLYHRILQDARHHDPAILDFQEIVSRQFGAWSMGLVSTVVDNQALFLKYATGAQFDPYEMRPETLRAFFTELMNNTRWLA